MLECTISIYFHIFAIIKNVSLTNNTFQAKFSTKGILKIYLYSGATQIGKLMDIDKNI